MYSYIRLISYIINKYELFEFALFVSVVFVACFSPDFTNRKCAVNKNVIEAVFFFLESSLS